MSQQGSNKTHKPTPKKLQDARKEGNFRFSNTLAMTVSLLLTLGVVSLMIGNLPAIFERAFSFSLTSIQQPFSRSVAGFGGLLLVELLAFVGVVWAVAAIGGYLGNVMQVGFVFQGSKFKKGLDAINPVNNVKNIFGKRGFATVFVNIVVAVLTLYTTYSLVLADVNIIDRLYGQRLHILGALGEMAEYVLRILFVSAFSLAVPVALDFFLQHQFYIKDNMMSHDEIEKELKETEGDPHIKGHRKQMGREIVDGEPRIQGASAILRNPTHYAIALRYEPNLSPSPYIVAMGKDGEALAILEEAKKAGIPDYTDVPFARALYNEGKVNEMVPLEFVEPLTRFVAWLTNNHPSRIYYQGEFAQTMTGVGNVTTY